LIVKEAGRSRKSVEKLISEIKPHLKVAKDNNLEKEVIAYAIQWIKDDPTATIKQAIIEGLAEYDL
jgi:hypothetical protein